MYNKQIVQSSNLCHLVTQKKCHILKVEILLHTQVSDGMLIWNLILPVLVIAINQFFVLCI